MHIRFHNSSRCPKRAIPKCSIFVCKRQEKELGIAPFITLRPALCALESLSCISRVALCVGLPLCCKICEGRSFASRGGQCCFDRLRLLEHRQLALGHRVRPVVSADAGRRFTTTPLPAVLNFFFIPSTWQLAALPDSQT